MTQPIKQLRGRPQKGYPKPFNMSAEQIAKRIFANAKPVKPIQPRPRRNTK